VWFIFFSGFWRPAANFGWSIAAVRPNFPLSQLKRNGDIGGQVDCLPVARCRPEADLLCHSLRFFIEPMS
jgi:hypothetical protein